MYLSFDQGWEKVSQNVQKIFVYLIQNTQQNNIILTKKEYSESYTIIYDLCNQKHPYDFNKECYEKYAEVLKSYLINHVQQEITQKDNLEILIDLKYQWEKYQILLKFLNGFFTYLDRSYIMHNNLQTLSQVGEKQFLNIILHKCKENIINSFIMELEKSRQNQISDLKILNNTYFIIKKLSNQNCQILIDLQNSILHQSQKTFSKFQLQWQINLNYAEYFEKAENFMKEEEKRLFSILQNEIINQILKSYYNTVILPYKPILIEEGLQKMLENNETQNLERMYLLYNKLDDDFQGIKGKFKEYIVNVGKSMINEKLSQINQQGKDDINDQTFIKNLINFQDSIQTLIQNTFQRNKNFERSMQEGFEQFLNVKIKEKAIAEYLAVFSDKMLKSQGIERLSEDQLNFYITNIVILFNSLNDKDIFMNLYHSYFAERILSGKFNLESEFKVILQIKMRFGDITERLETMLNDFQQVNDTNNKFQEYLDNNNIQMQFQKQIKVLNKTVWPVYNSIDSIIPDQIKSAQDIFQKFHQENNRFYKLEWINIKSTVVMNIKFNAGKHELTLNLLQASILFLFDQKKQDHIIQYQEIKQIIKHDDDTIKKLLAPLCLGKIKILIKQNEQKVITQQDQFQFNYDLKCQNKKINIPFVITEQTFKKDKVQDNRELAIEAAIVRIMKTRKILKYQDILQEVNNSLQMFQPDVKITKKKVEQLIEKEFLERDKNDINLLKYIA